MLGVPAEAIEALTAERDENWFEVWPDNWDAVAAFLTVQTQWRMIGMVHGGAYWLGLDYAGVAAGLAGAGIAASAALWADLQAIEVAARNALNGT